MIRVNKGRRIIKSTHIMPIRGLRLVSWPSSARGGGRTPAKVTCPHEGPERFNSSETDAKFVQSHTWNPEE